MRKRAIFPVAAAALMLVITTTAEAKNRDGALEFGAMGSYFDMDAIVNDNLQSVENSPGYGIRFGYHFSSAIEVEVMATRQDTENLSGTRDVKFLRTLAVITGNFLTDRETHTIPYISAGIGVINETRDAFTPEGGSEVNESFDSSAVLSIGVGGRTFFTDNFGVRYEIRYAHHDSFEELQDEFVSSVGVTWVVGGQD